MKQDIFAAVKEKVGLVDFLRSKGIEVSTGRAICCPFHRDSDPSFQVYADGHAHCFGCGWHGDVVDAAIGLNGHGLATPFQAALWLAERFGVA